MDLKNLRMSVILIPGLIFISVITLGFYFGDYFIATLNTAFEWLMWNAGWMLSIGMLLFVGFMVVLLFHPIGKIKLGGQKAKPNMTYWQWFAVSLTAGIGTGIVFWGSANPLLHTMNPAPGLGYEAGSNSAVIWAMRTTFMHWTLTPYAIYVTFAVILAYVFYNMKRKQNVSAGFVPLIGDAAEKPKFAAFIDTLTVFAIVGGIAGSFGFGLLQLRSGLETIFDIEISGNWIYFVIAAVIIVAYIISSLTGLSKGITFLAKGNTKIFLGLMIFFLVFGPTAYIFNLMTQSVGSYIGNFVESMVYTEPFPNSELWPQWWDMFWWADWLSFGPIMGLFFLKLGYGRTIRQFVVVNWLLPAVFGIIWFSVFGGTVLYAQLFQEIDMNYILEVDGAESLAFATFDLVPLSAILRVVMFITIVISFVTLSDSMVSTISTTSLKENSKVSEAPAYLKIFWGVLIGGAALVFSLTGGIEGIQMVKTFAGFPILFVGVGMLVGFIKYMSKRPRNADGTFVEEEALADNGG